MPFDAKALEKPFKSLNLGKKVGPLPRGAWLGIGVGTVGIVWYVRKKRAESAAMSTDTTTAGSSADSSGNPVAATPGYTPDSGAGSASYQAPPGGSDFTGGSGGVYQPNPTGQLGMNQTDTGGILPEIVPPSDGATNANPGSAGTQPSLTTNIGGNAIGTENVYNFRGSKARTKAHHTKTHKAIHAYSNAADHKGDSLHPVHARQVHRKPNPPTHPHAAQHMPTHTQRHPGRW